ncbi:hypothetical protein SAMD00019534_071410 [Acytostelium subglobosum LB1]|uniref:hypothetical protein n=1 Tax=Acytostelium subglobosum LB1 TaxID=1410327 RepID=UPI00064496F2|nr:hypothetical protein SAMD00019534_071410 [Acytostelium subglobosum LB1]GAM23966.1 hypothetical protein SAMD00019534_071410 [Acytostelium subglobosum LB1]|eukprot:XP_012753002.1 hypothetical protein SAMD00019534_071410 [Acytostelium subglobosum LB1]
MDTPQYQQHKRDIEQRETIVLCTVFSECGDYLVAANNFGYINIWYLNTPLLHGGSVSSSNSSNHINGNNKQQQQQQMMMIDHQYDDYTCSYSFKAHNTPVNCLLFYDDSQLLSSDDTEIRAWDWQLIKDIIKSKREDPTASGVNRTIKHLYDIPSPQKVGTRGALSERSEINGMDRDSNGKLYIGCGNSNAYCWDIRSGRNVASFVGHKDYVHQVKWNRSYNTLITSSEDATVRIWDTNTAQCQTILTPHLKKSMAPDSTSTTNGHVNGTSTPASSEQQSNHWTGALDFDVTGNWLVVGGSTLTMWYLGKLNTMSAMLSNRPCESFHSVIFEKDRVMACGSERIVNYYGLDGNLLMKVPSTNDILYTLAYNPLQRNQILVAGGTSPLINTYINQENIAFSYYFNNNDSSSSS